MGLNYFKNTMLKRSLRKFEYFDCKPVSTSYDLNSQLKKNTIYNVAQTKYAQIIRSLMYLMNYTKLDIAYAVGRLSRYTQSLNQDHWATIHRILKYLRGTIDHGLCYNGFPSVLKGFSDANWIFDSGGDLLVGMFLPSEKVQFLGNLSNKYTSLNLLWRLSLLPQRRQILRLSFLKTS